MKFYRSTSLPLLGLLLLLSCASFVQGFNAVPRWTLNLDLPPSERWAGAIDTVLAHHPWEYSIGRILDYYLEPLEAAPEFVFPLLEHITAAHHSEMFAEVNGIIAKLQNVSLHFNSTMKNKYWGVIYGYELSHATGAGRLAEIYAKSCTGILTLPVNRSLAMLHGRNMDKKPAAARNATLHITVVKNGTVLYEVFDWTWLTSGFATSARKGGITLEDNWRMGTYRNALEIVEMLNQGAMPLVWAQRHAMENNMDFDETLNFYNTTAFASPFYLIMSGTGRRGAVIAVGWNATDNVIDIIDDSSSQSFMIETNYDRWKPDPKDDPRRTVAHNALMSLTPERRGTRLGLYMALGTYPVHNPATLFTTLMTTGEDAQDGPTIEGWTRVPMYPMQ